MSDFGTLWDQSQKYAQCCLPVGDEKGLHSSLLHDGNSPLYLRLSASAREFSTHWITSLHLY
jgi:hypothetical protein